MGGPSFTDYPALSGSMGDFAKWLFDKPVGATVFPAEAPLFSNYAAKEPVVEQAIVEAVKNAAGEKGIAGLRATPYKGTVRAADGSATSPLTGSIIKMDNNNQWTNGVNDVVGSGTLAMSELNVGDSFILTGGDDKNRVFTVTEITDDTHFKARHYGFFYGFGIEPPGVNTFAKLTGAVNTVSSPALPVMFNPQEYMGSEDDANSVLFMGLTEAAMSLTSDVDLPIASAVFESTPFSGALTEAQMGMVTFASAALAAAALMKSHAAAEAALPFALAELDKISTVNVDATIAAYVQPLINALVTERNADVASMQKSYTIANGFFNSNVGDRVTEINNKYAVQIAKLTADAGLSVMRMLGERASTALQLLAKWENVPLRDRVLATELRLKAAQVGRALVDSSNNLVSTHWASLYNYSKDSVTRDFANDMTLWGAREENMRFLAEINQAYLGTVNAGIGKGWSVSDTMKAAMGAVQIAGGVAAMFVPGGQIAGAGLLAGGAGTLTTTGRIGNGGMPM